MSVLFREELELPVRGKSQRMTVRETVRSKEKVKAVCFGGERVHSALVDHFRLGRNRNEYRKERAFSGLYFTSEKYDPSHLRYGNMALVTTHPNVTYKRAWLRGAWFDDLQEFRDDLTEDGRLTDLNYDTPSPDRRPDTGSLGVCETLRPGETKEIRFILTWYVPNSPCCAVRPAFG